MKRLAVVFNQDSGKTETSKKEITKLFDAKQFQLKYFDIKKGVNKLQQSIQNYKPHSIIAVGGDGTVNAVATLATELQLPMGVIPAGTLNHFAKDMNLPTDMAEAAAIISKQNITKIDHGTVNDHIFVNNCNLGGYPEAVIKRDQLNVSSKLLAGILAALHVSSDHKRQRFDLVIDGTSHSAKAGSLFIGNNCYQLEGTQFSTRTKLDEGKLQLIIVKTGRVRHLLTILIGFIMKRIHQKVTIFEAQQIQISSDKKHYNVAVDGEVLRLDVPLEIAIHRKGLQILK